MVPASPLTLILSSPDFVVSVPTLPAIVILFLPSFAFSMAMLAALLMVIVSLPLRESSKLTLPLSIVIISLPSVP